MNTTQNQRERVSKLLLLYASQPEEVDRLHFGDVGVILGLKHTRTGDTLVSTHGSRSSVSPLLGDFQTIVIPSAVMSASVVPQSHSDIRLVQDALHSLVRTDPSVRVESQEGQLLVHGLGALHLEIVEGRLRDEWSARFEFGRRRVTYREGLGPGEQRATQCEWKIDVSGKPVIVTVPLRVRPMHENEKADPVWDGNLVLGPDDKPLPLSDTYSDNPLAHVACGISSALSASPNTSLGMSRIFIQVCGFHLPPDAPLSILAGGAAAILRDRFRDAGIGPLLEPHVRLNISVTEDSMGKVVKNLTENDGEVQEMTSDAVRMADGENAGPFSEVGVYIPPDWLSPSACTKDTRQPQARQTINAIAPLNRMLDFSNKLRSLTGGHGQFEMTSIGFREVSEARRLEILKEIGLRN
jgi:elongation factor G